MTQPVARMAITKHMQTQCFSDPDLERIAAITEFSPASMEQWSDDAQLEAIRGAEILITGWGSRNVNDAMLEAAPSLRLVCHSAGSIKGIFNPSFVEKGIRVVSAASMNSRTVAEFSFGMMLVCMKGVFQYHAATLEGRWNQREYIDWVREPFGATVGIIGASIAGRGMIEWCKHLDLEAILVYDPYLDPAEAETLGVEKTELDALMRRSDVVSLHTPSTPETRHIINADNLALMKDRAIFINTARGACVDEDALIVELEKCRIFACLDVTHPEPPKPESPLWRLPNCVLTPHVAGDIKESRMLQGQLVADEIERYVKGAPLEHEVDLSQLHRLA